MIKTNKYLNISLASLALLVLGIFSFTSPGNGQGPHGGMVKKADNYFIEMKCAETILHAYLLNQNLKTVDPKDLLGEAKFIFSDSSDTHSQLKPDKEDGFTCPAPARFSACKITFTIAGRSVSAEFLNPTLVVQRK